MSEELLGGRPRSSLEVVISQELPGSRELPGCPRSSLELCMQMVSSWERSQVL